VNVVVARSQYGNKYLIVPFLATLGTADMRVARAPRLLRLARYDAALTLRRVLHAKREELVTCIP
jgi:hypothetical protein